MRIINVASTAHMMGKVDMSDLMREKSYSAWEAYGEWKEMQPMHGRVQSCWWLKPRSRRSLPVCMPASSNASVGAHILCIPPFPPNGSCERRRPTSYLPKTLNPKPRTSCQLTW